ncbi:hypothetical protein [uncultured Roseovarius sp.]|uniref:hypothetical protein n=1 Tax=uncultured Roseovarius sp. TaxID=293344 RepID=UPI00263744D4|nr:hypothetical protein [uncultured Roseovarius sp.]
MKPGEFLRLLISNPQKIIFRGFRSDVARKVEDLYYREKGKRFAATPVNSVEICVLGMRRSGNHAVIHWLEMIGTQSPGVVVHLNNLAPGDNGYRHRIWYPEPLSADQHDIFRKGRRKSLGAGDVGLLIRSYEDISYDAFTSDQNRPFFYGGTKKKISLVIVRDPANLFASRLKSGFTQTKVDGVGQEQLYLDTLKKAKSDPDTKILFFNDFVRNPEYRRRLLADMEIDAEDRDPTAKMSGYGGGSSFQESEVSIGKLTARYEAMLDNAEFEKILTNPQIIQEFKENFASEYSEFMRITNEK